MRVWVPVAIVGMVVEVLVLVHFAVRAVPRRTCCVAFVSVLVDVNVFAGKQASGVSLK